MKVFINEKEYEYTSDYPEGWSFVSKDYFKFPVYFGSIPCFIKRFQLRPQNALVWELLSKLKHKNEPGLSRIHDVVAAEEKKSAIRYVFYEFIEGATLDKVLHKNTTLDLERMTNDLFSGVQSIHKHDYWFTDLCEKNVFCEKSGRFKLIDIDSCLPLTVAPNNDLDVSMFYYALVYNFFRDVMQVDIKPDDIPGHSLNHLQILFLILNLKVNALQSLDHTSDRVFRELPARLNEIDPSFKTLFQKVLDRGQTPAATFEVQEIRQAIIEKILFPERRVLRRRDPERIEKLAVEAVKEEVPVISHFKADLTSAKKGQDITLSWQVSHASKLVLKRNGVALVQPKAADAAIIVAAIPEGEKKQIQFSLVALNGIQKMESEPVTITIYDTVDTVKEDKTTKQTTTGTRIKLVPVLAILLAALLIGYAVNKFQKRPPKPLVTNFAPKSTKEKSSIIITGRDFPKAAENMKVFFNDVTGRIQYNSRSLIRVQVPDMGTRSRNAYVKLALVIDKDTINTPGVLTVLR